MAYGELPQQKGFIDSSYRIPVSVPPKYTEKEKLKATPKTIYDTVKPKDESIKNKPIFTR